MRIQTTAAAGALVVTGFLAAPAAFAQPTYPPAAPSASPITGGGGGAVVTPTGGGGTVETGGGGSLPFTGQSIGLIALVGGAAVVTGAGVVMALRRPGDTPSNERDLRAG